jgi:hypothetical protein
VALNPGQAIKLAHAFFDLRESTWLVHLTTQVRPVRGSSSQSRVAATTLSFWESATHLKSPFVVSISGCARLFCTQQLYEWAPNKGVRR